jgi:sulfide dehydrogenase cytochrome subunit
MKKKMIHIALAAGGLLASSALWAAGPTPAAMLSNTCAGCHGTNGASAGPSSPILGGQPAGYIAAEMKKFKSGDRPSTIMGKLARAYSDEDFQAMDAFFAQEKFVRTKQAADPAKVAKGKQLHEQNCKKCHLDGGRDSEDGGILAGQWKDYLQIAVEEFQGAKRHMPKKMADRFKELSKDDLDALVQYYASQE